MSRAQQPENDGIQILRNVDSCTPMSIRDGVLRIDWYNADEGLRGDYDPEDPNDINLLRFDVYVMREPEEWDDSDDGWRAVDSASYCTNIPATASEEVLEKALRFLFQEYREVIEDYPHNSVKKLGESLSHISDTDF